MDASRFRRAFWASVGNHRNFRENRRIPWRPRAPFILEWSPTLLYSLPPQRQERELVNIVLFFWANFDFLLHIKIRQNCCLLQNPWSTQLLFPSYHCTPNSRHFSRILSKCVPFTLGTQKSVVRALATESASPPPAKMVKAIRVHDLGGPEVLKWEDVEVGEPKEGEVRVKNKAIGLNFIDVYFRKGVYKAATIPYTPGGEACGVVTAVGPGLTGRQVGDLVAYAGQPMGSYAEEQILPADRVVPVPPSIDPSVAASLLSKGMTAQFLLRSCFKVEPGHAVLVHAAAGGVGSLLCQWANALGATVIGTVSTKEKAAQAKEDGCHHVIISKEEDFVARVKEITSDNGVEVVYDSVGKDTFEGSLACLKTRGYMVSFGQSSGAPDPVPLSAIAVKSLFLTRPSLFNYAATRDELLGMAGEVFGNVQSGVLRVRVNHTYPLSQAAQAHEDIENRKTSGSVVLIP